MITVSDYLMGRDKTYPLEYTETIKKNAQETVERVNRLLEFLGETRRVTSGWRPSQVNKSTPGASRGSRHVTAEACDLEDKDGSMDAWCMANLEILETLNLYLEHPDATPGWCHISTAAPASGNRVFRP